MISTTALTSLLIGSLFATTCAAPSVATLNDGTAYRSGSVEGLTWQSSGVLTHGCTSSSPSISDCFGMTLSSNPNSQLDPGNWTSRQRNELHFPPQVDGSTWSYQWKHYLASGIGSTSHFFHLMQVFSTTDDGPIVTLDAVQGTVRVADEERNCSPCGGSVSLSSFEGRTTHHSLVVTSGKTGKLVYLVTDANSGARILSYSVSGYMGSGTYIKFGTYRATQDITTGVTAYVGDFSSAKQ